MEFNFLNKHRIYLPDQYANERSPKSPHSLAERLTLEVWEVEEITLLRKYLSPDDSVLEMGACIGVLSVVTNSMLGGSSKHTVVEADPKLIPVLERNREMNQSSFEIINAIAGVPSDVEQQFRTSSFILGGSQFKETGEAITLPVVGLSQFKDDYNFLIMDIEGGEYHFIDTFIAEIRCFEKLMIEFHPFHGYTKEDVNRYIAKLRGEGFRAVQRIGHTVMFVKSPPHELHFFCENPKQVELAGSILEGVGPAGGNARVFTVDPDGRAVAAMRPELDQLHASTVFVNVMDLLNEREGEIMRKGDAKMRAGMIRDALFDYLHHLHDGHGMAVVLFDDSSLHGLAVSQVCRNMSIQRILVQSDFLGLVSKTDSIELSDLSSRFGSSRPELTCVWGPRTAAKLTGELGNRPDRVKTVGCTLAGVMLEGAPAGSRSVNPGSAVRVLWVDQPVIDSGMASRLVWLREFRRMTAVLASYDCRYLPHPSTAAGIQAELDSILGTKITRIDPENAPAIGDLLRECDVCVTFHSSVFLQCITHGVPCVFAGMESLDVEMPEIHHPLLFRAKGLDSLAGTIAGAVASQGAESTAGSDLDQFVAGSNGIQKVIGEITGFLDWLAPGHTMPESESSLVADEPAEPAKTLLAVGGSFGSHIGVGMSLSSLFAIRNRLPFKMALHVCHRGNVRRLKEKVLAADYVIFNSLEVTAILTTLQLNDLLRLCREHGKKVFFYLHETNFTFLRLRLEQPDKVENLLKCVLPTVNVLCVSEAQARWIRNLGAGVTGVVHEAVSVPFDSRPAAPAAADRAVVTMAGTIQPRKGVTLFSRTADLARAAGDALDFQWLGQTIRNSEKCYLSEHVNWRGFLAGPEFWDAMLHTDVFVLSSVDDPFPLSVGQALFLGKPCIVYRESGFAEVIERNHWGEVYDHHDEEDLYRKIRRVVGNPSAYAIDFDEVKSLLSVDAFATRLIELIGTMPESPCFDRETLVSRVGADYLDECDFLLPDVPESQEESRRAAVRTALGFRVDHKHFEIDGVVPEIIRSMEEIRIKPIEMAKAMMAIGRHDVARAISEACLQKNPESRFHQNIVEACRIEESKTGAK